MAKLLESSKRASSGLKLEPTMIDAGSAVAPLLATAFLGETLSSGDVAGIVLITLGAILVATT
jgi:uncharacterized membrane protein